MPLNRSFHYVISNASDSRSGSNFSPLLASPPSSLTRNQSSSRLGRASYECDKDRYGQPPIESCVEAYSWIRDVSKAVVKFGDRTAPDTPDVLLPLRISSSMLPPCMTIYNNMEFLTRGSNDEIGDGTCVFDLHSNVAGGSDLWSDYQLRGTAHRMLNKCVLGEEHAGGIAERLGQLPCS